MIIKSNNFRRLVSVINIRDIEKSCVPRVKKYFEAKTVN